MTEKEFSAGGLVIKRQRNCLKVLLIKDGYGRWTWPKGKIEKGESPPEAAIREVGEETGLAAIEIIKDIGKNEYFYRRAGKLIFKTVYIYLFRHNKDEPLKIQTDEIQAGQWLSPEEAIERIDYKDTKQIIKKAVEAFETNEKQERR